MHTDFPTCWLTDQLPLLHLFPSLSKIARGKEHFDHQLGRFPMAAVYKENQHKFCLNVLHSSPEIHFTYLKGEALERLALTLAFRTLRSRITELLGLQVFSHYLG